MSQHPNPSQALVTTDLESVLGTSSDTLTESSDGHKRLIADHEPIRAYYVEFGKYVSKYLAESMFYPLVLI